ncbi:uncharacterized protein N7506_007506 [Penicillium brevicompactum]|uniref:uncharacterized protein n=1 Tax=Penicillium brevicompactum TaxID=5074 RepID=UPI00254209A6|nr:uncharacterized protein N7506_007506 [Penicillium brevicompactum]KAJ5333723.1 hypothetical protein N7506_007506 [Penicillium brevicompactum]
MGENEGYEEYDWLQNFLPHGGQAAYDLIQDEGVEQAYQAFQGAEDVANSNSIHSQVQNAPPARSSNHGVNRVPNASMAYSQLRTERDGGQSRHPNVRQQPSAFAQPSSRSEHQPNHFPQRTPSFNPPNTLQQYLSQHAQTQHASFATQQRAHGQPARNPQQGNHGTSNANLSASTTGAARRVSGGQQTTRPTSFAQTPGTAARRGQAGSGNQYQQSVPRSGHHVQSGHGGQPHYGDPFAEIRRRNQIMMMNPNREYNWPPIPPSEFQNSLASTNSPQPPPRVTHSPITRPQTTPQGHSSVPGRGVLRPPNSASLQANHPSTIARSQQGTAQHGQGPSQLQSLNPAQIALRPPHQLNALRHREGIETSVARANFDAEHPTLAPEHASERPLDSQRAQQPSKTQFQHITHGNAQPPVAPEGMTRSEPILINSSTPSPVEQPVASPAPESSGFNAPVIASTPQEQLIAHRNDHGKLAPAYQGAITTHGSFNPGFSYPAHLPVSYSGTTLSKSVAAQARPRPGRKSDIYQPRPRLLSDPIVSTDQDRGSTEPPKKVRRLNQPKRQPYVPKTRPTMPHSVARSWQHPPTEDSSQPRTGKILKNRDDLVQPTVDILEPDEIRYDPALIVRSLLVAAGQHPNEEPLNDHLEELEKRFVRIDGRSDLRTFRWDMVDAKNPAVVIKEPAPAPAALAPPVYHAPKLNPGSMALPVPGNPRASIQVPGLTQPSVRWSLQQQGPAPHPRGGPPTQPNIPPYDGPRDAPPAGTRLTPTTIPIDACPPSNRLNAQGTGPLKTPSYPSPSIIVPTSVSKFPKTSSSSTPIVSIPISPHRKLPTTTRETKSPSQPKQSTPKVTPGAKPDVNVPTSTGKSQPASSQVFKSPETSRLPQPKVVITPSPQKMTERRKPGRPPKNPAPGVEVRVPEAKPLVKYPVYACQWKSCAAELHNLEGIKAHVVKTHVPHHLVCQWKGCEHTTPMAAAGMYAHVTKEHIMKLAWQLGDGPTVPEPVALTLEEPSSPTPPSAPKATMILPVNVTQLQAYSKVYGIRSEIEKAEAILDAGRHWKQQIGPDLDQDSRRLSSPPRQANVYCAETAFISPE